MNQQPTDDTTPPGPLTAARKEGIREGIRLERERVIRLLMSPRYRNAPSEDSAMVIHNGIHWGEL